MWFSVQRHVAKIVQKNSEFLNVTRKISRPLCVGVINKNFKERNNGLRQRAFHTSSNLNNLKRFGFLMSPFGFFLSPLKYLSSRFKLLLIRGYFDPNFNEKEFIRGATEALLVVYENISNGNYKDLEDLFTQKGLKSAKDIHSTVNKSNFVLDKSKITNVFLEDIGFEYGESGQKWAYFLVHYICTELNEGSFGGQIWKLSFCQEYTQGENSGFVIDDTEVYNLETIKLF